RDITDPTSWLYLAAMHGFNERLWRALGYLTPTAQVPPPTATDLYWDQCQHHTWYFLPWHRGYLAAFEAIVRAAIVGLGGPDDWALPYWNYNETSPAQAKTLPTPFRQPNMPDGSSNPLFVARRVNNVELPAGTFEDGPQDSLDGGLAQALRDADFNGPGGGGSPGFGGVATPFQHNGTQANFASEGFLEQSPHDEVHGDVGGPGGLMANPQTAALDPIFWLHHANIDRLWEVWLRRDPAHQNPTDPDWLNGPVDQNFAMPAPDGSFYPFTAADVLDTTAPNLDYAYEDVSDPLPGATRLATRAARLGLAPATRGALMPAAKPTVELLGANKASVTLGETAVQTEVQVDPGVAAKVARSFAPATRGEPHEPDRIFLNLENIRGTNDAAKFQVYVNLPEHADPAAYPDHLAGTITLFGVSEASTRGGSGGGNGISKVLEITRLVDALHLSGAQLGQLNVRIVPAGNVEPGQQISVDRVSVYRQGR
ncbi:MAG TPA: tyrosinase family protein, partial [Acetobacteraceae bacterium]|nr:tyrosinase family protein [Acetobacteraceae bacterium]